MENVRGHFNDQREDLYACYRLAKTREEMRKIIRDMQRFNMEAREYREVIPLITTSSLKQSAFQKPDNPFLNFGRMMEASP